MSKTIFITGASSGIGKATAKLFHEKGFNVVATMRNPDQEAELKSFKNIFVTRLDVLDLKSIEEAIAAGIARFGTIDILVNNAGYGAYGPLESFKRESIIRQFDTNVMGLIDVTRAITPHFRKNRSGVLVNISSIGGKMTFPLGSLYHGTKFAVEGISESLSFEFEQFGAKVKIVEPGFISTDFGGRSFDFQNDASLLEYQDMVGKLFQTWKESGSNISPAQLVAQVVHDAAMDTSSRLRYRAGQDAEEILDSRTKLSEDEFISNIKKQFKLA